MVIPGTEDKVYIEIGSGASMELTMKDGTRYTAAEIAGYPRLTKHRSDCTRIHPGQDCEGGWYTGALRDEEPKACKGFQWVGQSFASCDGCGQPFWEHTYDTRVKHGAGPFDDDPFEYVLITDKQKAACRAKWGAR